MTNTEYLQMLEMDRARKGRSMQNPTREDVQRMQQMISPSQSGSRMQNFGQGLGNLFNDIGVSIGRGSEDVGARNIGNSYQMSHERDAQEEQKAMKILQLLNREKKAKEMQEYRNAQLDMRRNQMNSQSDYRNSHLSEIERHHKAMEGRQSSQERRYSREEEKELETEMENKKLQEIEPGAFYLKNIPTSERNQYVKAQQTAIKGLSSQKEAVRALKRMKDLVKNNPGISNYINSVFGPGKGGLGTLNQLRMIDKDRTALNLFDKYQKDLIKLKVESLSGSGARPNMFLEKIVSGSVGELGMTADALTENFDFSIAEMNRSVNAKNKIKKDIARRIYNPYSMDSEEEAQGEETSIPLQSENQSSGLSLKAVQEAIARKKRMMQ